MLMKNGLCFKMGLFGCHGNIGYVIFYISFVKVFFIYFAQSWHITKYKNCLYILVEKQIHLLIHIDKKTILFSYAHIYTHIYGNVHTCAYTERAGYIHAMVSPLKSSNREAVYPTHMYPLMRRI